MFEYIPNPLVIPIGLVIGVLVAAPVGPVNVLCIQRALERGVVGGVIAGLGAVLGDGIIALSASLGVSAISGAVETHKEMIQLVGGGALIVFGLSLWFKAPQTIGAISSVRDVPLRAYAFDISKTFFLTVTNPGAVLGLFAIFGGISTFVELRGYSDALLLVAAIAAGNFAWWLFLSLLIGRFSQRFEGRSLMHINKIAGVLLIVFGSLLVAEVFAVQMGFADNGFIV